jgi:RNA 2',3'-cyclic 3'-phosphodiesterase
MRLFFAAMLPPEMQRLLHRACGALGWLPARGSFVAPENLHITLKFLGEMSDAKAAELALAAQERLKSDGPLTLRPSGLVLFPPRGAARVMAVGFEGDTQALIGLQAQIEAICQEQGFAREARGYVPHATLVRFRNGLLPVHHPRVRESCSDLRRLGECRLEAIQLMQSSLTAAGSRYTRMGEYLL